jgi:type III pantothenate kinase
MKLLLDVGNSRIKWAWLVGEVLEDPGDAPLRVDADVGFPAAIHAAGRHPEEILIASVAGPIRTRSIADALGHHFHVPVRVAESERHAVGVRNGYLDPGRLGVDRWLAMLAAYARYRTAVCVVDAGTAMTIDAVAADGSHQGGLIVPGLTLMRAALIRDTGDIESAIAAQPPQTGDEAGFWGRETATCIHRGATNALTGLVTSCVDALREGGTVDVVLVLTGGDAPSLLGRLTRRAEMRPLLVLEGLALRHGGSAPPAAPLAGLPTDPR